MKKLLSILLATAMLISLIPAVFAADTATEAGIKVVYDFKGKFVVDEKYDSLTYNKTYGFWAYDANSEDHQTITTGTGGVRVYNKNRDYIAVMANNPKYTEQNNGNLYWIAFKLYIPKSGTYTIKLNAIPAEYGKSTWINAYIFDANSVRDVEEVIGSQEKMKTSKFSGDTEGKTFTLATKELPAGEYYFVYMPESDRTGKVNNVSGQPQSGTFVYLNSLTLTEGDGTLKVPMYYPGEIEDVQLEVGESKEVTGTMTHWSDGKEYDGDAVTYTGESENEAVAVYENNEIVAKGTGNTTITVKSSDGYFVRDVNVKVVKQDEELTNAFDDAVKVAAPNDYIAPTVDSIDATGIVGTPVPQADGSYKITAPETAENRGEFLYWKKAMTTNEKIVSLVREFNYVPEDNERNILVAVYEGDITSTSPKCYNANGQYLPEAEPVAADLPSMAGYGKAYDWKQYGDTNVYVAQYRAETPIADIDVTVKGENTSGGGTDLAYGAPVTCKATGANFKYWKKTYGDGTAKIVSTEAEYTFNAWENCTVEAVYEENVYYTGSKMKIIIDSFTAGDETGVMAEFLGLGNNVVEKGIMFNNNRIAMTTVGNQFSVIADADGTYTGYVIVEETDGLKLITDGEYENN